MTNWIKELAGLVDGDDVTIVAGKAAFDDGESTKDEWNKLTKEAAKCKDFNGRIADVAEEITRLTDAVNGYNIDKVTSVDKADTEKLIADIDTLLNGDNLALWIALLFINGGIVTGTTVVSKKKRRSEN